MLRRFLAAVAEQRQDLPLFAALQVPLLAFNVLLAKALAARHAYPAASAAEFLGRFLRVLPQDVLMLAIVCLAILLARRLRVPSASRPLLLAVIYACFAFGTIVHYVNAGFFIMFGAPLNADLLRLAPAMLGHASKVMTADNAPMLQLTALTVLAPLVVTPVLWWTVRGALVKGERSWTPLPWATVVVLSAAGLAMAVAPVAGYREVSLRGLSAFSLLLPVYSRAEVRRATLTAQHRRVITDLLGPVAHGGADAFKALPRRRWNILVWVWESVGERFLRSHHPLGEVDTPHLDRLARQGAVRFSRIYTECPLSAQTDWALQTAMSPPSDPRVFKTRAALPSHGPLLPAVLRSAGYRTAFLSSSYLESWGEIRFLRDAGLDLLEDAETLRNRERYRSERWSIEGRALNERFFEWRDGLEPGRPFFAVLWNVESHHPYTWVGMPPELRNASDARRYLGAIAHTDRLLGELYDGLVARGLERDTLVVVIGDHGEGLGRGGHWEDRVHSQLVTEDDLHVPLVFLHPQLLGRPDVVDVPATHTDIYPTLLDLAGIPVPEGLEGASLARPFQPRVLVGRAITWWPVCVRAGRYKLVQDRPDVPPRLYDVVADTWEASDLASSQRTIADGLSAYLRWLVAERLSDDPRVRAGSS